MKSSKRAKSIFQALCAGILFFTFSQPACGWELELGVHHLLPKLWTGEQSYKSSSNGSLKFKPIINKTISGQTASIGLFFENVLVNYEQGLYKFETTIPASNPAVGSDTSAEVEITEQRLGINYHLERELAGFFFGAGVTRESEKVITDFGSWIYEEDVPFLKFGIDLIFDSVRIRVEQLHYSFGEHSAKVSSAGILLHL